VARREYPATFQCAQPACGERVRYEYETRGDHDKASRRNAEHPWKCSRHADPDANLRPDNTSTERVLISGRGRDGKALYWRQAGAPAGSGFSVEYGPGFCAYAADFPEGTRLTITARIEMPAPEGEL
jgi:hypothetical protein